MENLEDDLGAETINASANEVALENIGTADTGPSNNNQPENNVDDNDDSVEIIENPIDVLDLTSPEPSTSCSNSAGAVGSSTSIIKRNLEETLIKKECNTDQNPSTSASANGTSSSTSSGGNNGANVLECPICLQTCIHPARLPCGHIFCFLCVKGVAYKNRRCAMCRREIPPEFLDHPQLVNGIEDICTTKATDDGYQWFYEGRNGGWWAYEQRSDSQIEAAFQKFLNKFSYHQMLLDIFKKQTKLKKKETKRLKTNNSQDDSDEDDDDDESEGEEENEDTSTCKLQICGSTYVVDFPNMVQYPHDMPYRKRKICRAKGLPAKGVAGILTKRKDHRMHPY